MQRVFVTGASGLVGRSLLPALARSGARVVALARDPARVPSSVRALPGVTWIAGDLTSPGAWSASLADCAAVVHLAATTGKAAPDEYVRVNADGTRGLVSAARQHGVNGFVHVSTIAVKFPDQRRYFYAHSKAAAEEIVRSSGLPHVVVRPTIVVGPGAPVLGGLAKLAGAPVVPVFGSGEVEVQPIAVSDLAECLAELVTSRRFDGETIELGGAERLPIEAFLQRIRKHLGRSPGRVVHVPLGPVRAVLALLEPLLLPVLPLTCGQLATFANDGTADASAFMSERAAALTELDATLCGALDGE